MAASIGSTQLQTMWCLYRENKTFRYSIYALEILALASLRQNTVHASVAVLGVSVCFLGHKIRLDYPNLRKLYSQKTLVDQAAIISRLTRSLFTVMLIWGITLTGWNLSCAWREGKLLLHGNRDLFTCLNALNSLGSLSSFWAPFALFLIQEGDQFFHSNCGETTETFLTNFLDAYQKNLHLDFLKPYLTELKSHAKKSKIPFKIPEIVSIANSLPDMELSSLKKVMLFIRNFDLSTPKVVRQKNPTLLERVKNVVNYSLFYGMALSMLGIRFYYHPIPTTAAFLCGLFYPTRFQPKKDLEQRWERVPDFINLTLRGKCTYFYDHTSSTLGRLRFGYPAAFLKGLLLAEEFRYYIWPHLKSWIPLPIEPLIPETGDNRWQNYLKDEFAQINPLERDQSDYHEFKQKILNGKSPRKLLGLEIGYTSEDVQKAYKKYALTLHPDIAANEINPGRNAEATVLFKCLRKANKQLKKSVEADQPSYASSTKPNLVIDQTSQPD